MSKCNKNDHHLKTFLQGPGFVVLTLNESEPSHHGPFEAWAYQGPLDFNTASPATFGVGASIQDSLDALELQLEETQKHLQRQKAASLATDGPIPLCVNRRELATILAALRFHQDENLQDDRKNPDEAIDDIATDSGKLLPLNFKEVGKLCERLNTGEGLSPTPGLVIEPPHEENGEYSLFRVVYVIDVNAAGPADAAQQTYDIMTDPDSQPPVLEVIDFRGTIVSLDLSKDVTTNRQVGPTSSHPAIRRIHDLLYLDVQDGREFYNPDKNWDAETITAVADVVADFIPRPNDPSENGGEQ